MNWNLFIGGINRALASAQLCIVIFVPSSIHRHHYCRHRNRFPVSRNHWYVHTSNHFVGTSTGRRLVRSVRAVKMWPIKLQLQLQITTTYSNFLKQMQSTEYGQLQNCSLPCENVLESIWNFRGNMQRRSKGFWRPGRRLQFGAPPPPPTPQKNWNSPKFAKSLKFFTKYGYLKNK